MKMDLNEAQRILNKSGLLMEESKPIVNTYFIDNVIEELTKTKEELKNLGTEVWKILFKLGIRDCKIGLYGKGGTEWYLSAGFKEGGSIDFELNGEEIEVSYTINGYGSKTCTKDRLEITIKRILRKEDVEFNED